MRLSPDLIKLEPNRIQANLTLIGYKEGEYFIIFSPALDLYAAGTNEDEAFLSFDQTAKLFFEHSVKAKLLEKDLKRLGWKKHHHFKKRFNPPDYNTTKIMAKKDITDFSVRLGRQIAVQA